MGKVHKNLQYLLNSELFLRMKKRVQNHKLDTLKELDHIYNSLGDAEEYLDELKKIFGLWDGCFNFYKLKLIWLYENLNFDNLIPYVLKGNNQNFCDNFSFNLLYLK